MEYEYINKKENNYNQNEGKKNYFNKEKNFD